jgi:hypothetical protein
MSQPSYPPQPEYGWAPPPPPPRRRWPQVLAWVVALPVLGVAIGWGAVLLTKDDSSASPAACKTVLADGYRKVMANGGKGPEQKQPPECVGLDTETLKKITGEVISEYLDSEQAKEDLGKAFDDGVASAMPSASASISPECRKWIGKELLDGSSSVDGTAGYAACGDLSDAEMQSAIDGVEKELEASIAASP